MTEHIAIVAVIEGITIALVAAAILGLHRWVSTWLRQREQMQYLRDIIATGHRQIKDAEPVGEMSEDIVRFLLFESVLRDLSPALSHRTDSIGYKQKYELQRTLVHVSGFMSEMKIGRGPGRNIPSGLRFYEQHFFEKIRKVEWLAISSPQPLE